MSAAATSAAAAEVCRPMPRDLKVLSTVIFLLTLAGGLVGPFYAQSMAADVRTSAFIGSANGIAGLSGAFLLSRASDLTSRRAVLWVSFGGNALSSMLGLFLTSKSTWFIPMLLGSFCMAGTSSVVRAFFGDFCKSMGASSTESTAWISTMSLCVAIPTVVAPALGPRLASSFHTMQLVNVVSTVSITPIILLLSPPKGNAQPADAQPADAAPGFLKFLNIKAARTAAGIWVLFWCFLMVFAYNVCQTMIMPSLKARFNIDAKMAGDLSSAGGLGAMVGYMMAGPLERRFCRPHPTYLMSVFMYVTFSCRVVMFTASNYSVVVLAGFVLSIFGVGIVGPIRSNILVEFAPQEELGGFIGLHAAVENISGIVGPLFAGTLSLDLTANPRSVGFLVIYATTPLYAFFGYSYIMRPVIDLRRKEKAEKVD